MSNELKTRHNELVKTGDHIEWESDRQTDRGPCCGTVWWIKDGIICVKFGPTDFDHWKLADMDFTGVSLHHRTGKPLFFAT
jgi:hypothetical protein